MSPREKLDAAFTAVRGTLLDISREIDAIALKSVCNDRDTDIRCMEKLSSLCNVEMAKLASDICLLSNAISPDAMGGNGDGNNDG